MENIIMLILGVFISVVGIVNIKGNISTIHSYNRRKVKEEDIPKYGKRIVSIYVFQIGDRSVSVPSVRVNIPGKTDPWNQ